jgi:hypothetical protein
MSPSACQNVPFPSALFSSRVVILGANAGRKHTDNIPLEVVASSTGHMITTPDELHTERTNHYINHHALPEEHQNDLHTSQDWLRAVW